MTVDEAHCISQWGQDFRPSYLKIVDFLKVFPHRPVVSAFTATATARVREDVEKILDLHDPERVATGFDRPNLRFEVRRPKDKNAELLKLLWERRDKTGIIYCTTRKDVESVCQLLRSRDIGATRYHAGLAERERQENQEDFIYDRANVMVATNAFGMGIDKSNVSYVIHYSMPQSLEAYYQEAGRAGRDGAGAECILFYAPRDVYTAKWLVEHSSGESELTEEQEQKRIRQDLNRLDRMVDYCKTGLCLRGRILDYFGQDHPYRCGNCGNCDEKTHREETLPLAVSRKQERRPSPAGLLEALKALRWDIAKKTGQPAYIIFTNASLEDMARKAPRTQEEFLKVNGVGSSKAQRYGQAFLECIREYTASHGED